MFRYGWRASECPMQAYIEQVVRESGTERLNAVRPRTYCGAVVRRAFCAVRTGCGNAIRPLRRSPSSALTIQAP